MAPVSLPGPGFLPYMSHSNIDLDLATVDEMNIFLAERLEELCPCHKQRLPRTLPTPGSASFGLPATRVLTRTGHRRRLTWRRYWK